jgi:hypothetical protein
MASITHVEVRRLVIGKKRLISGMRETSSRLPSPSINGAHSGALNHGF